VIGEALVGYMDVTTGDSLSTNVILQTTTGGWSG
jgi:hypothetical protein